MCLFQVKRKRPAPKPRGCSPAQQQEALNTEDHVTVSPSKQWYKTKLQETEDERLHLKKKIKTLQQSKRRLTQKKITAEEIIRGIEEQKLLSEEGSKMFDAAFSPDIQQLLHRARTESGGKYPPELRTFALTLHFYSPAAYEFVRSKFNDALPSQRTIREWYRSVDGQPGFTGEAFSFLEKLVQGRSETLYCALIVDDMSIRKHVELVGDRVVGYVDFGASLDDDSLPEATNVCVYIVVGINMRLKIPVGYFLIHSLTGSERAELTKQCIERLESVKVQVVSLTFDGASSNFTMAKCLGAELKPDPVEFSTSFKNPVDESRDVHILLDPCHMIKLIRNSLATMCYITDVDGNHIKWAYIKALEALQRGRA